MPLASKDDIPMDTAIDEEEDDRWFQFDPEKLRSTDQSCSGRPNNLFYSPSCNGMRVCCCYMLEDHHCAIAGPLNSGDPRTPFTPDEIERATIYLASAYRRIADSRREGEDAMSAAPFSIGMPLKMKWGESAHMAGIVIKSKRSRAFPDAPLDQVCVYQIETERYPGHDFVNGYTHHQREMVTPFLQAHDLKCDEADWVHAVCHQDREQCEGWSTFYIALASLGYEPSEISSIMGGCNTLQREIMAPLLSPLVAEFRKQVRACQEVAGKATIPHIRLHGVPTNTNALLRLVAQPLLSSRQFDIRGSVPLIVGSGGCSRSTAAEEFMDSCSYDAVDIAQLPEETSSYLFERIRDRSGTRPVDGETSVGLVDYKRPLADPANASVLDHMVATSSAQLPWIFMPVHNTDRLQYIGSVDSASLF